MDEVQKGLLGAAIGGIFGGLSGSGDTQGSQGYTGGIPDLTASRTLVPGVFDSTYTTPAGELAPRTPGSSGRRYFTDVKYDPVTDAAGLPTIMGAAEFQAANQAALERQQELTNLGTGLLGTYEQNLANQQAAGAGAGVVPAATPAAGAGVVPEAAAGAGTGAAVVPEAAAGAGAGAADPNAAFNSFMAPFSAQSTLTPAQLIQLGGSGYDLSTIASTLKVDPTALSNAIAQATSAAQTQSVFDAVDPSDGFSDDEAASIANLILGGQTGIGGVANQFEGVSEMDVIEGMLRGGYESPAAMTERLAPYNTDLTEVQLMESLLSQGRTTPEELAAYYSNNPDYPEYAGVTADQVRAYAKERGIEGYAAGGDINGYYLGGTTDGMADQIPATIDNTQPAALSDGEFVVPADVVSHLGNGNSDAGAKNLYSMMDRVRTDRTGSSKQGRQIDPNKYLA